MISLSKRFQCLQATKKYDTIWRASIYEIHTRSRDVSMCIETSNKYEELCQKEENTNTYWEIN